MLHAKGELTTCDSLFRQFEIHVVVVGTRAVDERPRGVRRVEEGGRRLGRGSRCCRRVRVGSNGAALLVDRRVRDGRVVDRTAAGYAVTPASTRTTSELASPVRIASSSDRFSGGASKRGLLTVGGSGSLGKASAASSAGFRTLMARCSGKSTAQGDWAAADSASRPAQLRPVLEQISKFRGQ